MMKQTLLALAVLTLFLPTAPRTQAQTEVSIDFFYNNLNDGNWVEVGDYGYCWQPNVAVSNSEWRPYSDGYWAYTDVGWTWVSNEDFGWATYHYGRWVRLEDQGWVWVPGYEWGPAWVSWRTGGDYVGWAPLPPTRERVYEGRAITGHVDVEFDIGPNYYNFVDVRYIGEPVLRERIVPVAQNVTVIYNTVNVTNITYNNSVVYNYGPDYDRVTQYSVRPVQRLTLQREANANLTTGITTQSVTKVEGQKLVVAAPQKIQQPAKAVAPKNVKAKLAQAKVERGWSAIKDPQTKNQLVQKMKTEDPKNVPPPKVTPNQRAAGAASPAAGAPPAAPTNGSPAAARATAPTPPAQTAEATATAPPSTPAATPAMTPPQHTEERGRAAAAAAAGAAAGAAINEHNQATPAAPAHGRHGKAAAQPTMTPSREGTATEQTPPQSRKERGKARGGRGLEEQSPAAKATPNAQERNAAAGVAPEDQTAGRKGGRNNARSQREGKPHQEQNELAPTGQSSNVEAHRGRGSATEEGAQAQPNAGEKRKSGGGGRHKKDAEPSPTPGG
jgi:hypothetical protein